MSYVDFPALRPIRHLLVDPAVSEIMINGPMQLFVERGGKIETLPPAFGSQAQLDAAVEALTGLTGRTVNTRSPFVDFRLPDGARVNIVVPPIALRGPVVTIRRPSAALRTLDDLVQRGMLTARMAGFLVSAVRGRTNIVFSGGTGSGKTTLLAMLAQYIPPEERIVVIEDTAELTFGQPNVVRMECRPPNVEGTGGVTLSDLLRNSMRMRPTRIVVGEVRGEEAFDLLNALASGHEGGFAVLHASSPQQAVARLQMMVLNRGLPFPLWAIQRQISNAVDLIVQHALLPDGTRRVTHVTAVQGMLDEDVFLQDVFTFEQPDAGTVGRNAGTFACTGIEPVWWPRVRRACGPSVDALLSKGPA